MSAVRMCDRCGTIFSENAAGWGVGTMSTSVYDEKTRRTSMVQQSIDLCPADNKGPTQHLMPQIAGVPEAERLSATLTAEPGHNHD